ncbi:hypothetical protein [Natronomonas sp. EA1]|uniref:hypothetical protein n=1 Tax=Natronomonas sp. EA1 TaxID=3421655 RepID=UPI003EBC5E01
MIPDGELVRSRVLADVATLFEDALDRAHTGYAVLEPADAMLFEEEGSAVITFESGVPVLAYHTRTERGGESALADLAAPGPYQVALYDSAPGDLTAAHESDAFRVPPGAPAEKLAGAPQLADRARRAAPEWVREEEEHAVEAFLADEEKIQAIREQARAEAQAKAEEWGFDDAV